MGSNPRLMISTGKLRMSLTTTLLQQLTHYQTSSLMTYSIKRHTLLLFCESNNYKKKSTSRMIALDIICQTSDYHWWGRWSDCSLFHVDCPFYTLIVCLFHNLRQWLLTYEDPKFTSVTSARPKFLQRCIIIKSVTADKFHCCQFKQRASFFSITAWCNWKVKMPRNQKRNLKLSFEISSSFQNISSCAQK